MARPILIVVSALLFGIAAARAELLLNEVLYDPPGADGDAEFVELFALGADTLDLDGIALDFCNGATPGDWRGLWSAPPGLRLAPGALFLIGEAAVAGAQATVTLDLQNGPDALRLRRGEQVLDLLGYGAELDPALYEAAPAPDAVGLALARCPDGVDTDQNALDWSAAEPSPGALNLPDFDARLLAARAPWLPIDPARPCTLLVELANRGALDWPAGLSLRVDGRPRVAAPRLAPEQTAALALPLPPLPAGEHEAGIALLGPAGTTLDSLRLPLRSGLGELMLSEVLFAPASPEPEWVELLCRAPQSGLESYRLRDLGGTELEFAPPPLAAGTRFLLCGDRAALLARRPGLDPVRVLEARPWPSLANSGSAEAAPAWSDGLALDDAAGRRVDAMLYRGDWVPERGWSIERLEVYPLGGLPPWAPAALGATPLSAEPLPPPSEAELQLWPNPFDPGSERLRIDLRAEGESLELRLFDAAGRRVQLLTASLATGRARLVWDGHAEDGRALADGIYPLHFAWTEPGGRRRQLRAVVGLRGRR